MSRGMEHPGAPQRGDDSPRGIRTGPLERHPASKEPSSLVAVVASPFRRSSFSTPEGDSRVNLYELQDMAGLSDEDLEAHAVTVARVVADLQEQEARLGEERERRKRDKARQLAAERESKMAEKARLERELAEIDAALAVMDRPQTAGNA